MTPRLYTFKDVLAMVPCSERTLRTVIAQCGFVAGRGRIFARWKDQRTVNHWLRRLCNGLEIAFTPHRARHTVGKRLSDSGASLRTIMAKLTHANVQSSMRYQAGDIETVRAASELAKRRGA